METEQPQSQHLSMDDVMGTLRSMFQGVDDAVLQTVLEANEGRVESTIDQLLQIQGSSNGDSQGGSNEPSSSMEPPPPAPERSSSRQQGQRSRRSGSTRWKHPLPPDFLKVPGTPATRQASPSSAISDDQLFANIQLLETEEGAEMLRHDPRLRAHLEAEKRYWQRAQRHSQPPGAQQPRSLSVAEALDRAEGGGGDTWGSIKRGVHNMGTGVKNRFQSIAEKIRRYKAERQGRYQSLDDDDQQQLVGQSNDDDEGEQRQRPQQQQRNNYSILNEDDTEIVLDDSLSPMDEREETRK